MSFQLKIKDEPLDRGYGDEVSAQSTLDNLDSNASICEADIPNSERPLVDKDELEGRNPAVIKNEPIEIKTELEQVLPDDLFDCLYDKIFDVIEKNREGDLSEGDVTHNSSNENHNNTNVEVNTETSVRQKRRKSKKKRNKTSRKSKGRHHRSHNTKRDHDRSRSSDDNYSPPRKHRKTRSISRTLTSSLSRSPPSRETTQSPPSRERKRLSRSRSSSRSPSRNKTSSRRSDRNYKSKNSHSTTKQILVRKDELFSEDQVDKLLQEQKYNELRKNTLEKELEVPLVSKCKSSSVFQGATSTNDYLERSNTIPLSICTRQKPMDETEESRTEQTISLPPNYASIKGENIDPLASRKKIVLDMCSNAIKNLHSYEQKKMNNKFLYTPLAIRQVDITQKMENSSPLNRLNNVKFTFNSSTNNIDLKPYGLVNLPKNTSKVALIIGFDAVKIMDKLNIQNVPYSLRLLRKNKNTEPDKFYSPFFTSTETQTETFSCSSCILRQLRKFKDKDTQTTFFSRDAKTQTDFSNMQQSSMMSASMPQQQYAQYQQFYPPVNQQMSSTMYNYGQQGAQPNQYMQQQNFPYYPNSHPMLQGEIPSNSNYMQQQSMINNSGGPVQNPALLNSQIQNQSQKVYPPISTMPIHPGPRSYPIPAIETNRDRRNLTELPMNYHPTR